ncbi:MAG: FtsX-like permease family protein, partial [Longimicrobiales bacterium]
APDTLPIIAQPELGIDSFAFALVATVLALAIFALAPALRLAAVQPADVLRSGERGMSQGRALRRLRDGLVVVQVAVGLVLLSGAGVLVRSLMHLNATPLGVDASDVLTFEVNLPDARYDPDARARFHRSLNERLTGLPGVVHAGAVSWLPVNGRYHTWGFYWDPNAPDGSNDAAWTGVDVRVFDGEYFATMGIPVLRGAHPAAARAVGQGQRWISRTVAEQVFGDADPIGQYVLSGPRRWQVAGIVGDVAFDPRGGVARTVYIPHVQFADDRNWTLTQVVGVDGDASAVAPSVRDALAQMDPALVMHRTRTFDQHLDSVRARDRFATTLMVTFAVLAFVLTILGTYGVLAGSVAGRRREIGIRMALGAGTASVRALVMRHALAMVLPGIVIGLAGTFASSRWLRSLLFEVEPADPLVMGVALTLILGISLLAGWLAARTATSVDPARTLMDG